MGKKTWQCSRTQYTGVIIILSKSIVWMCELTARNYRHKFTAAGLTSLQSVSLRCWLLCWGGKRKVELLPTPEGVCQARWGPSAHRTQTPNGGVFSSWTPPAGWPDSHVSAAAGTTRAYGQWETKVWADQTLSCLEIILKQPVFFWLPLVYFAHYKSRMCSCAHDASPREVTNDMIRVLL